MNHDILRCLLPAVPLLAGWLIDRLLADPAWLPHPVVLFGHAIAKEERMLNRGRARVLKGAIMTVLLVSAVYTAAWAIRNMLPMWARLVYDTIGIFYCLAGTTLINEVRAVFRAVDRSLAAGRRQVARIVGRDTSALTAQQVRTAALETLAENLSDGVVAPLCWYAVAGVPGMLAYKMINTLDSMVGYKNDRYLQFGRFAARLDDAANWIPARLTAALMVVASGRLRLFSFVGNYGRCHASPNSGYPEAALAGILDCRFGGPNRYFGTTIDKPYIGHHDRPLTSADMHTAVRINRRAELLMLCLLLLWLLSGLRFPLVAG